MFEVAVKARLPLIGVTTDDLVNFEAIVQSIAGESPEKMEKFPAGVIPSGKLYWTRNAELATAYLYTKMLQKDGSVIFVNCPPNDLVFDSGLLPSPEPLLWATLKEHVEESNKLPILRALKGLSPKTALEMTTLAQTAYGELTEDSIRRVRGSLSSNVQGLYPIDTSYDFYDCPKELHNWLELNAPYFHAENHQLVPRGLLFNGPAGTGKSMAAKKIAREFNVPLYRLDIATTLDRFVGVSENRVAKILSLADREAPCVLLIDEIEKIFTDHTDTGVTQRIMSQLLWWLSEHQSRVFTVMTTNRIGKIPVEMYRPGRIDKVMKLMGMHIADALHFGELVFGSIMQEEMSPLQRDVLASRLHTLFTNNSQIEQVTMVQIVKDLIKEFSWYKA